MEKKNYWKLIGNFLMIALILGIIFYVLQHSIVDIIHQLGNTNIFLLLGIISLGVVYQIVEGKNIAGIAQHFQKDFSNQDGFFCSCYIAFCRVITFGTGTLVAEVFYYRKREIHTSKAMGITALHMILYKLSVLTYSFIFLIFLFPTIWTYQHRVVYLIIFCMLATAIIISFILVVCSNAKFHTGLIRFANKHIKKETWRAKIDQLNTQVYSIRETIQTIMLNRYSLLYLLFLNLFKLFFWFIIPYVYLIGSHDISFMLSFILCSFTVMIAGVIPTPAGIGSFEFFYMLFYTPLVGTVDAAASLLLYRFATYVLPFFIGMVYSALNKKNQINEELQGIKKAKESQMND